MPTVAPPPVYDELLNLFTNAADVERLFEFRLAPDQQARLDSLLERNRTADLTESEQGELDEFERLEHLGRMLKARARQKHRR